MEAIGVLPDAGREPHQANALSFSPFRLAKACGTACGEHGVCDELHGRCLCQLGWGGDACQTPSFPACRLSDAAQPAPAIAVPCASLRRLAPVACECIAQCLAARREVCGPLSFGCQRVWRARARRWTRSTSEPDLTTREGFHTALTCLAHPANTSAHSGLPAHPAARIVSFAQFARLGYDGSAPHAPPALSAFGAGGKGGRESRPAGAEWVDNSLCPGGCSARGRCLRTPGGSGLRGRRARRQLGRGGMGESSLSCVCADGAYGPSCEHVCSNDCFNDCSVSDAMIRTRV